MPAAADVDCSCLIAEPDPFIASLLLRYAEGCGLECVRAKASDDIVELARRLKPRVIIIDAELPGDMIGWEIMRVLKLGEATQHIALISCSWLNELEVRSLVGNLAGHLQKPDFSYNAFEQVLRATGVLTANPKNAESPPSHSDRAGQFRSDLQTKGERL